MKKIFGLLIVIVIVVGVTSRLVNTDFLVIDKYLGDTLYAVMFYLILSFFYETLQPWKKSLIVLGFMIGIEAFQLTGIPLSLRFHGNFFLKILSILLGTEFAWLDILAYLIGILTIYFADQFCINKLSVDEEE